jgi:hypothetical protein
VAVEDHAALRKTRGLALQSEESFTAQMHDKVVRMALTEWDQDGEITSDKLRQNFRFGCISLEGCRHNLAAYPPIEHMFAHEADGNLLS